MGGLPSGPPGTILSAVMDENEDPRAPFKVYEGDEQKCTYRRVLKRGGGNSNSKRASEPSFQHRRQTLQYCYVTGLT
jgi:hypothetical protein